jgi:ThiF family protein
VVAADRFEPETETHRTEKALRQIVDGARLPLTRGDVEVSIEESPAGSPAGQHLLVLLVQLLTRMKGIVHRIAIRGRVDAPALPGVPLAAGTLQDGLEALVRSLSGARSEFRVAIRFQKQRVDQADVRVGIGTRQGVDLCLAADSWRALLGRFTEAASWSDESPIGPYLAATIGAAEVFKRLMRLNFPGSEGILVDDLAFSLFDFGIDDQATWGRDVPGLHLRNLAVAGAGAGGSAALYTLSSFTDVAGEIVVVEPGRLKESSLGRYLMSDYEQVHAGVPKLSSVETFLGTHAPGIHVVAEPSHWHEVRHRWGTVICTVDTPEARWDVQRSGPDTILDAGVMGTIYAVLRVIPGGWCLECKHPPDPDVTWKKRSRMWGLSVDALKHRFGSHMRVTRQDLERLCLIQGRPLEDFLPLEGLPIDELPAVTECGQTSLSLVVPSQAPVLPLTTTAAGVLLAAEVVKQMAGVGTPLANYFAHDLRYRPRTDAVHFRPRRADCLGCGAA